MNYHLDKKQITFIIFLDNFKISSKYVFDEFRNASLKVRSRVINVLE